jgi:Flp pilus assembly protein TadG
MKRLLSRLRNDEGQVLILVAVGMVALVGMAAFVVDVGGWFRQQRATQSIVDAAALAGAQALPNNPANAILIAKDYGAKNGVAGELADANITITSTYGPNDTITVTDSKPASFFFGGIFNAVGFDISRTGSAMVGAPSAVKYVAPIGVNILHPDLTGAACGQDALPDPNARPCLGPSHVTTIPLNKTGAPGSFDLLNLNQGQTNGTVGSSTMSSWITNGFDKYLPAGGYFSDPGAKYNSSNVGNAINARLGTDLLFPVYDTLSGTGSNAIYHVVYWVGFHLLPGTTFDGSSGFLVGYFTGEKVDGVMPSGGGTPPPYGNLGLLTVSLVN